VQDLNAQNAPHTIAPEITCNPGATVDIPITVTDFNNIGALSLTFQFDGLVLDYQSYTNNSGFPGLLIFEQTPGKITAGGFIQYGDPGINLPDNSVLFTLAFYCNEGSTGLQWFDDGGSCEYTDDQFNPLNDSPTCSYYTNGSVNDNSFQLELKVFLEGAFQNGEMTTELNDLGLIPTSQPYSGSPWYYDGLEAVSSIHENVVDWVLVELRESTGDASTATVDKVIAKQAGFLLKDGTIKNASDCGFHNLDFSVSYTDNLYIVIFHRNHVAAISANPIAILNGNGIYDFSSAESKVLGGSLGHKELSSGIWGLAAGDSNGDGNIDEMDKQNEWAQHTGTWGYLLSDFSFDSQIDNFDKNDFWNLNFGFIGRVPIE
jgi:hypothetical protein